MRSGRSGSYDLDSVAMQPVVVILGPTAVGKSRLALSVSERFAGEIVNADALQVYRGLERGTAKPSPKDRARVPHHLIDILEPRDAFSAGEFARRARTAISEIRRRRHVPVVVGGSGFYLRALLTPLSPIPEIPLSVRQALRQRLEQEGLDVLRRELSEVDEDTERRLSVGDTQRVLRALEVWVATSRTLSSWKEERSDEDSLEAVKVGLTLPRRLLYDRIAARVEVMLEAGWVDEVANLLASGYSGREPAFQAIGYRQLIDHLRRQTELLEAVGEIVGSTRRYAKRQMTWFRRDSEIRWYDASEVDELTEMVCADLVAALGPEGAR